MWKHLANVQMYICEGPRSLSAGAVNARWAAATSSRAHRVLRDARSGDTDKF